MDSQEPIPLVLHCPRCRRQHIDMAEPETGWTNPPHRSHSCDRCHLVWRVGDVATAGVLATLTDGGADSEPTPLTPWSPGVPVSASERAALQELMRCVREGLPLGVSPRVVVDLIELGAVRFVRGKAQVTSRGEELLATPMVRGLWMLANQGSAKIGEVCGSNDEEVAARWRRQGLALQYFAPKAV